MHFKESLMPAIESPISTATVLTPEYAVQPKTRFSPATLPNRPKLLSVSADAEDHAVLQRMLSGLGMLVEAVFSCQDALDYLRHDRVGVIFCESSMSDGSWKDLLNQLSTAAEAPPLVVTSRLADDYLWSEVLNLGGWDVLAKPFRQQEVLYVLDSAWNHKATPDARIQVAGAA
jgi:FixJ family two-component response regulator